MPDTTTQVLATKFTADVAEALKGIEQLKNAFSSVVSAATSFNAEMESSTSAVKLFSSIITTASASVKSFQDLLDKTAKESSKLAESVKASSSVIAETAKAATDGAKATTVYEQAVEQITKQFGDNKVAMKSIINEATKLENTYHQLNQQGLDTTRVLGGQYNAVNLVSKAIQDWSQKGKAAIPMLENVSKANSALKTGLTDTEFGLTSLGKTFFATSNRGKEFFDALVQGGKEYGIHSTKMEVFSKSLLDVHKHLSSIPESSKNYQNVLDELSNSSMLSARATELMNGHISKSKDGFIALSDEALVAGTVMDSYGQMLLELEGKHKNLRKALETYSTEQKNNSVKVNEAAQSLLKYGDSAEQVRSLQKYLADEMIRSNQPIKDHSGNLLSAADSSAKLRQEKGELTKFLNNEATMLEFVRQGYTGTKEELMRFAAENLKGSASVQEFWKELNGLNKGLEKVGQYGKMYSDSLSNMTKETFSNKGAVEQAVSSHLKYAQTAEGLIAQMGAVSKQLIANAKDTQYYNGEILKKSEYIKKVSDDEKLFAETLRSTSTIQDTTTRSVRNMTEALLAQAEKSGVSAAAINRLHDSSYKHLQMLPGYEKLVTALNNAIDKGTISNRDAAVMFEKSKTVLDEHRQKVEESRKAQEKLQVQMEKQQTVVQRLIGKIKELSMYYASAAILYGLTTAVRSSIAAMADFDQTLHGLKAITNATDVEMNVLGDTMREIARNSRYSVEEIGGALTIMGQAGLDAVESMNSIKAATDLAMGTMEKMEPVVDLLTTTMTAFGMNALESTRIADAMAVAINQSKLSVDKLRTAFNYIGLTAAQMGLSLEETNATLMVMADAGMKASTMGTSFRQVLSKLVAPNEKLREAYEASGISLAKINPLTAGYGSALQSLSEVLWDSEKNTVKVAKAYELFGLRGAQAAIAIVRAFVKGDYQEAMEALSESGMAAEMAAEQMEGMTAKFENLVSRLKELAITIGELGVTDILKGLIDGLSGLVSGAQIVLSAFSELNPYVKAVINSITELSLAVGITLLSLWKWGSAVAIVGAATAKLTVIWKALTDAFIALQLIIEANPWIKLATVIGLAAIGLWNFMKAQEKATEALSENALKLKTNADTLTIFAAALEKTGGSGRGYESLLKQFIQEHPELTKKILETSKASSLYNLDLKELQKAIQAVKVKDLEDALKAASEAFEIQRKKVEQVSEANMDLHVNTKKVADETKKYGEKLKDITKVAHEYQKQTGATDDELKEHLKTLIKSPVEIDKVITAVHKLAEQNKRMESSFKNVTEVGTSSYKKLYSDLNVLQKTYLVEIEKQKEQEIARLEDFAEKNADVARDLYALTMAIETQKNLEMLEKKSELTKKALESEEEKYARLIDLTDEKLALINGKIEGSLKDEKEIRTAFEDELYGLTEEVYKQIENQIRNHQEFRATQEQVKDQLILDRKRLFFETQKLYYETALSNLKSQMDLELNAFDKLETDKLAMQSKYQEISYQVASSYYESIRRQLGVSVEDTKKALKEKLDREKDYITALKAERDKLLEYISERYQAEQTLLDESYNHKETLLETEFEMEKSRITRSVQNVADRESQILALEKKYSEDSIALGEEEFNKQIALWNKKYSSLLGALDSEYAASKNALDQNYAAHLGFSKDIISLNKETSESMSEGYIDSYDNMRGYTKVALKDMGEDWKNHLDEQGLSYAETNEYVYILNKERTAKVKEEQGKELDAYKVTNEEIRKLDAKAVEELKTIITSRYDAVKSELDKEKAEYASLVSKLTSITNDIKNLDASYHDSMRKNRQMTMSDSQRYYDDMKEVNRLYNLGLETNDKSYFDKAKQLIESHTSAVEDKSGKVVVSLETLASTNSTWLTKLYSATKDVMKKEQEETQKAAEESKKKVEELKTAFDVLKKTKEELSAKEVEIKTDGARKTLEDLQKEVGKVQEKLRDIQMVINIDPFNQQIKTIYDSLGKLVDDSKQMKAEVPLNVVGGEKKEKVETFLDGVKKFIKSTSEEISKIITEVKTEVSMKLGGEEKKTFEEGLKEISTKIDTITNSIKENPLDLTVSTKGVDNNQNTYETLKLLDEMKSKADALESEDFIYNITVNGLDQLISAVDYQNQLQDKSVTHTINVVTNYSSTGDSGGDSNTEAADSGSTDGDLDYHIGGVVRKIRKFAEGGFNGKLPGYGGGDIVPALLEPGEFVIRKEAVKKYGSRLFKNLNKMRVSDFFADLFNVKTFSMGGAVLPGQKTNSFSPQQNSSQVPTQESQNLHVIEFRVNNDSYKLQGEGNVVQSLIKNMRRSRLVTV